MAMAVISAGTVVVVTDRAVQAVREELVSVPEDGVMGGRQWCNCPGAGGACIEERAMANEEDPVRRAADMAVGADLSMLSIEDLEARITLLAGEIERITTAIADKKRSKAAAETFFRR
jgi:uncharacterized small protein (DUF1192 family)